MPGAGTFSTVTEMVVFAAGGTVTLSTVSTAVSCADALAKIPTNTTKIAHRTAGQARRACNSVRFMRPPHQRAHSARIRAHLLYRTLREWEVTQITSAP
jgi:hypothetical protein